MANSEALVYNIDIDGNGEFDALTDGLLILRNLFGLTDSSLVSGALAANAIYVDSTEISTRINSLGLRLDVDDNGNIDALTDGLLILRYLFGLSGEALITGVVAPNANRNTIDQIESYISTLTNFDVEPPVFTSPSSFSVEENQTLVGTVTVTDVDSDESLISFSISGANLSISSDGILSFNRAPDYESQSQYNATISASDGFNTASQEIIINILNVIEPPYFVSPANFSVEENQDRVGVIQAWDVETSSSITSFSVSGDEFLLDEQSVLRFIQLPDYEGKRSYTATVTANAPDNRIGADQEITVLITDVDDSAPLWESSRSFSVAENQTVIGTVTATDVDTDDSLITYTVSGSEISITSDGFLTFVDAPDYETKTYYEALLTASDGINSTSGVLAVTITDIDDVAPVFASSASFSAAENQTSIGTLTATDTDTDDSLITYTVSGSEISITSDGVLTFVDAPDYETKTSYSATVTASDGTNSTTQDITITITDIDDTAPVFTSSASFSAAENQTSIGTVTATDVDTDNASITFSISGSELAITSGGVLTFASTPDYETKSSYSATVTASDGTNSSTQDITVTVTNVNDNSPVFTSGAAFSVAENQTSVGTVLANDADGDSLTYSLSGADASAFSINSSTGVITFNSAPDYETKTSYSVTVTASDGTNSTTQDITVTISNVNDNSPIITSSAFFQRYRKSTIDRDGDGDR